ncbi:hypothetical protein [Enemella sp. A6]|uniref:hypothetical protein n=1 Tax=Enemella sp. A6 TaxID=3440152 RepID=UPI003EBBDBD7
MTATNPNNDLEVLITQLLNAQEDMIKRIEALEHELAQRPHNSSSSDNTGDGEDDEETLGEWVEWLIETYHLELVIPSSWADHEAIRSELDALHQAHNAAYSDQASGWDKLTWHDHLTRALDRIDPSHTPGYTQRLRDYTLND